jgi:hypothetical protein
VVVVAGAAVGCDAAGLTAGSVAYTTDGVATDEIERRGVDVRWLTCTAGYGGASGAAGEETVASVECQGETGDGRDITVTGRVTRAVDGACVRGDLTAEVGAKQLFRVSGLGDCASATPSPVRPPDSGRPGQPTVTVTVTRTVWCTDDPQCGPKGK